jgi:hypothetical protein
MKGIGKSIEKYMSISLWSKPWDRKTPGTPGQLTAEGNQWIQRKPPKVKVKVRFVYSCV